MRPRRPILFALLVVMVAAGAASAAVQEAINPVAPVVGRPVVGGGGNPNCAGGEIHDDGIPENGYGWNPATVTDGREVDRFTPTSYPFTYTDACICWVRIGADADIDFNVQVFDDDGPAGAPGTLLGSVPAVATAVPNALPGAFYSFDITSMNLNITSGVVYIGAQWAPNVNQQFFVCSDQSVTTPLNVGWGFANALPWLSLPTLFPAYRSLLVRALGGPLPQDADLEITKTGLFDGTNVIFTVSVTNNGPDDATNTVVTDTLPPEVTYVSDDCGGANIPPWTWNVGTLTNGSTVTCNITTTPAPGFFGTIVNTATVTSDLNDPTPGNETSTATVFIEEPFEIPTLGTVGFALLALLLAAGAVWVLRRRTA
jgi:hypothetical protein